MKSSSISRFVMPTVVALLDSWEPLSDEDAIPVIEKLEVEPFDL